MRAASILTALLLLALPWSEGGDHPTGLAIVHLLALVAVLAMPVAARPALGGGIGAGWLCAFLLWGAAACLRPVYRFSALLEIWDQVVPAILLLALAHAPVAAPQKRRLAGALVASAALHAAWLIVLTVATGKRSGGAFVNPNFAAAHLYIALPVAVWLAARAGKRARRRWLAAAFLMGAALLASGSRGAVLLAAPAALMAGLCGVDQESWMRRWRVGRARIAAALALLALLALAGGSIWVRHSNLLSDPYRYDRLRIWSAAAGVWAGNPWAGVGPAQLQWVAPAHNFPLEERPFRYSRVWTSAHSTPLQLGVEEGWIGLALVLGFIAALARALWARSRVGGEGSALALAAFASLAGFLAHSLVDTPVENPAVLLSLAALMGLALAPAAAGAPAAEPAGAAGLRRGLQWLGAPGLAALALAVWGALLAPLAAHRSQLRFQEEREPRAALRALDRALRLNPYQPAYALQRARVVWQAKGRFDLQRLALAEHLLERASELNPGSPRADTERGRLLMHAAMKGVLPPDSALRAALRRYEEAQRRAPQDARLRQEAGLAALRLGDAQRAAREARAALALEPNFLDPHLLLADAAQRAGRLDEARQALDGFSAARSRLQGYAPANDYERDLVKYNDAVLARLQREITP